MSLNWPPLWLGLLWLAWMFQAWWCWYNLGLTVRRVRRQQQRDQRDDVDFHPTAVVVVPVKGVDALFDDHVRCLLAQRDWRYRVMFVVESADDPACARLREIVERFTGSPEACYDASLLVAGQSTSGGQKVHNLRFALGHLREDDEVVVFADADAVPDDRWLERLVWPLCKVRVGVSTGYRWMIPADDHWASHFASVINASVATLAGPDRHNHVWGGSAALRRETIEQCRLADYWRGAISDDYQMTRAIAEQTDLRVYFVARCLVASPVRMTWRRLLSFGRRQYLITRIHAPGIWLIALFGTWLYVAGFLTATGMLIGGRLAALAPLIAVALMDFRRARLRRVVVRKAVGESVDQQLGKVWWLERLATPLWMAVHGLIVLSSVVGRRITWAGVTYQVNRRQDVRVVRRDVPPIVRDDGQPPGR